MTEWDGKSFIKRPGHLHGPLLTLAGNYYKKWERSARQHSSTDVESVVGTIGGIIVGKSAALVSKSSFATRDETERISNLGNFLERMEKLTLYTN